MHHSATFEGEDLPLKSLKVTVTPYQDLHGYDAPWTGGAGKNKLPLTVDKIKASNGGASTWNGNTKTINGVDITLQTNSNGDVVGIKANGTATNRVILYIFRGSQTPILANQTITISGFTGFQQYAWNDGSWHGNYIATYTTTISSSGINEIWVDIAEGATVDFIATPQIELGSNATSFAPYSNICPIIGWDEAVVNVADDVDNPTVSHEYTIDLDGTRYGGVLDATNGTMDDTLDYIASYNGEALPSTWISDRDVYAEGTTPTIGAEVVYTRATPITVQLAPTPARSIEGENNISANCGQITEVKYFKKA